ncbi:S-adenosyl-L-methionine-dependent methyltransferase [Lentinula raphanica]|nr:S-adenosyl-L-methionine-dependent methyltransferase [Lentinula raphanica]
MTVNPAKEPPPSTSSDASFSQDSSALYNNNPNFLLAAKPGEKIVDFGCGSGQVSVTIEKAVKQKEGGYVAAADFSESMVEKARTKGLMEAFVCDIQDFTFPPPGEYGGPREGFDAVFTNATLHWCKRDPAGVIKSAKKILKSDGGRLVGEMGGFLNCIGVCSALKTVLKSKGYDGTECDPWFFPSPEEYSKLLQAEGFTVSHISLMITPRLTPLEAGLYGWLSTFVRGSWLKDLSDGEAEAVMREVEEMCRVDCQDGNGNWAVVYVRLRVVAVLSDA